MNTTASIETISPEQAERYLALSEGNRPIRPGRVRQYAADMRTGQWLLTGEPIIFNGSALINGHHRLQACLASGASFPSVVVRNVDSKAYDVIDSGLARTVGDALGHHGVPSANITAAAARLFLGYKAGVIHDPQQFATIVGRQGLIDHVVECRPLWEWAMTGTTRARDTRLNSSAMAAFRALIGPDDERLETFCEGVYTGAQLDVGDPRLTLRTWAMNARLRSAAFHLSAIIRAWNAYSSGVALKNIRPWFQGSPFPVITPQQDAGGAA